ncbi:unnamed protein product [Echinostoma caproni]|uniref:Striatin domain-containing protein n=1 Tax=Echinostoma caproni TaxID=27848 RepID=A0A183AJS9_9TREM|nr:unnamed protein product [Echinostoma caproni]
MEARKPSYHAKVQSRYVVARIAFLVGERRGQENLKKDLVRRIKMLEYALKQERVKFHQFKASVAAAAQSGSRPPAEDSSNAASASVAVVPSRFLPDSPKPKPLEPCAKLNRTTKQTLEARRNWLESRCRLRQYLQEIGSADALLNVRQARVLQLLMSTPGWRGALDQEGAAIDPGVKQHLRLDGPWAGATSDEKANGVAGASDDLIESALAEMDQAVRTGNASRPELGDDCAEPDTTGQSLGGPDSYDSNDTTWVNRFRRTGGHSSGEQGRSKHTLGLGDEMSPTEGSVASAVSSFISGLKEGNNTDPESINITEFIDALSTDVDELRKRGNMKCQKASDSADDDIDDMLNYNVYGPQPPQPTSGLDAAKLPGANEGLALGDLATLTVANDLESGADGENCDAVGVTRGEFDPNVSGGHSGMTNEGSGSMVGTTTGPTTSSGHQTWQARYTLRGHLDGIRSVAFHPTESALYTAGEDGCVMLWNLSKSGSVMPSAGPGRAGAGRGVSSPMAELEPVHVYCGHDGAVLSVVTPSAAMAASSNVTAYTGGLDGTVRAWRLPAVCNTTGVIDLYAPHDLEQENGPVLRGSRGAVWALAVHPSRPLLTAAHADNAIEFWSTLESSESISTPTFTVHLDRVFKPAGTDIEPLGRPTCLHYLVNRPDSVGSSQCLIGTSTGWLFLLDVETGQIVSQCAPPPKSPSSAVTKTTGGFNQSRLLTYGRLSTSLRLRTNLLLDHVQAFCMPHPVDIADIGPG